jgi:predicted RNA-binding protein with PIN domain
MAAEHVIIDGYNVIHAIPSLKRTLLHDAQSARELLIHSTAQLTHKRNFRCTIVFDGIEPSVTAKGSVHAPVHVIYSSPLTADAKMRHMIEHSKNRSSLIIISSDREIVSYATACSCRTHTAKHFANLLSETDDAVTEKSDVSLTPHQINEWLKIFGEK